MAKLERHEAVAGVIQRLAADWETVWSFGSYVRADGSTHARDEMKADGIDFADLVYVLKHCNVIRSQYLPKYGETRYRAVGKNVDGIRMTFIVTLRGAKNIEIVTAWVNR